MKKGFFKKTGALMLAGGHIDCEHGAGAGVWCDNKNSHRVKSEAAEQSA